MILPAKIILSSSKQIKNVKKKIVNKN